jgi:ketosteroid isomerase-like protein
MKNTTQYLLALAAVIAAALASGCASPSHADTKTDEQTIRALDAQMGALAAKQDVEGEMALYAPDAAMLAPDAPAATNTDDIRSHWADAVRMPGFTLAIVPEKIEIAAGHDLATDMGLAEIGLDNPQGHSNLTGKYLGVWRKINGQWKIAYHSWSWNAPMPR